MTLVLSAHCDDAALSLGQTIAADDDCRILTVFAGIPGPDVRTDYDTARGFCSSAKAMHTRRVEDWHAACELGAKISWLDALDSQYRREEPRTFDLSLLALELSDAADWEHEHVLAPIGIGHPDHQLLAACARRAVGAGGELLLYQDIPYTALWPELVWPALRKFEDWGFTLEPYVMPVGDRETKRAALACYTSQDLDLDDPCVWVPERIWRAVR